MNNPFTSSELDLILRQFFLPNNRSSNLLTQKTKLTIVIPIEHVKQPDNLAGIHKNKFRLMTIKDCYVCVCRVRKKPAQLISKGAIIQFTSIYLIKIIHFNAFILQCVVNRVLRTGKREREKFVLFIIKHNIYCLKIGDYCNQQSKYRNATIVCFTYNLTKIFTVTRVISLHTINCWFSNINIWNIHSMRNHISLKWTA